MAHTEGRQRTLCAGRSSTSSWKALQVELKNFQVRLLPPSCTAPPARQATWQCLSGNRPAAALSGGRELCRAAELAAHALIEAAAGPWASQAAPRDRQARASPARARSGRQGVPCPPRAALPPSLALMEALSALAPGVS